MGNIAAGHILIRRLFCSFHLIHIPQEDLVICYMCACLFFLSLPPSTTPLMPRWRSIVFVLHVNVYHRVPTIDAYTSKVMYWHRRLHRDRAGALHVQLLQRVGLEGGGNTAVVQCGRRIDNTQNLPFFSDEKTHKDASGLFQSEKLPAEVLDILINLPSNIFFFLLHWATGG